MSETPQPQTQEASGPLAKIRTSVRGFFSNWKVRGVFIGILVLTLGLGGFLLKFFWNHIVAEQGMRIWSASANARPIECMIKDTNADGYVSCSATLDEEIVPLECGASIFNIGCRINYGAAAAPPLRSAPTVGPDGLKVR
ncbi:MAG: hypothetical protein SWY16_17850 [Cyanobacteriota bacterium]|nr:hypothetical protein [Cyanobacteriota bacterium]